MEQGSNSNSHSETEAEKLKLSLSSLQIQVISQVESRKNTTRTRTRHGTGSGSGFWSKLNLISSNVDVEPVYFLYNVVFQMALIMVIDFLYYQSCTVNLQMEEVYCTRNKTKNDAVAENVAESKIWQEVVDNVCTVTLSLFIGAWGDLYGRKVPILIVLSGNIIQAAGLLLIHLGFSDVTSVEVTAIVAILPIALTGQIPVMAMAAYSYGAASSSVKQRTLKVGVLSTVSSLGKSTGSAVVGVLKSRGHGYTLVFTLMGGLQLISFVYTLLVLKRRPGQGKGEGDGEVQGQRSNERKSAPGTFSLRHAFETAKCFFQQREGRIRLHVMLFAVVIALSNVPTSGERAVLQQFTFKQLSWNTSDFAFFSTYQQLFLAVGGILVLALLTQVFKLQDSSIGILATISKICGSFVYAFADRTWFMYLAPVVSILDKTTSTASRSMLSKLVPKEEFGKILSFTTVFMSLSQLTFDPVYAAIFRWTLTSFPGTFFFLSVAVTIPIFIIFTYFQLYSKQKQRKDGLLRDMTN